MVVRLIGIVAMLVGVVSAQQFVSINDSGAAVKNVITFAESELTIHCSISNSYTEDALRHVVVEKHCGSLKKVVLSATVPGTFRLAGYNVTTNKIYGFILNETVPIPFFELLVEHDGATPLYSHLGGRFYFASFAPNGNNLILVGEDVRQIDVASRRVVKKTQPNEFTFSEKLPKDVALDRLRAMISDQLVSVKWLQSSHQYKVFIDDQVVTFKM